jgi:hypothetical protein
VSPIAASTFAAGGRAETDAVPAAILTPDPYPAGILSNPSFVGDDGGYFQGIQEVEPRRSRCHRVE